MEQNVNLGTRQSHTASKSIKERTVRNRLLLFSEDPFGLVYDAVGLSGLSHKGAITVVINYRLGSDANLSHQPNFFQPLVVIKGNLPLSSSLTSSIFCQHWRWKMKKRKRSFLVVVEMHVVAQWVRIPYFVRKKELPFEVSWIF